MMTVMIIISITLHLSRNTYQGNSQKRLVKRQEAHTGMTN